MAKRADRFVVGVSGNYKIMGRRDEPEILRCNGMVWPMDYKMALKTKRSKMWYETPTIYELREVKPKKGR